MRYSCRIIPAIDPLKVHIKAICHLWCISLYSSKPYVTFAAHHECVPIGCNRHTSVELGGVQKGGSMVHGVRTFVGTLLISLLAVSIATSSPSTANASTREVTSSVHSSESAWPYCKPDSSYSYCKMNPVEKSWCRWPSRARVCYIAYLGPSGATWAMKQAAACPIPSLCTNGDEANALQHCLWSAMLKLNLGERTATGFLTRHEASSNNDADSQRDWKNNALGFEVARQVAVDAYMDTRLVLKHGVLDRCHDLAREERLVYVK